MDSKEIEVIPRVIQYRFELDHDCSTDCSEVAIAQMLSKAIDQSESRCEPMSLFSKTLLVFCVKSGREYRVERTCVRVSQLR